MQKTAKVIIDIIAGKKPARAMLTAPSRGLGISIPGQNSLAVGKRRFSSEVARQGA